MKTSKLLLILMSLIVCFSIGHAQKKAVKRTAARPSKVWDWQYKDKKDLRLLDVKAGVVLLSGYSRSRDKDDIIAVDAATGKLNVQVRPSSETSQLSATEGCALADRGKRRIYLDRLHLQRCGRLRSVEQTGSFRPADRGIKMDGGIWRPDPQS